jgi:hypothetical protein
MDETQSRPHLVFLKNFESHLCVGYEIFASPYQKGRRALHAMKK